MKECIQCKNVFEPYKEDVPCHNCGGEGYVEDDDNYLFNGSAYKRCWQCNGHGGITILQIHFCDDVCASEHFEDRDF